MAAVVEINETPFRIVECPRDAWQALPRQIPAEVKADYLRSLILAGFRHIDAISFVSPAAVPQMADSEQVLSLLGPADGVELIGIVVNEQGAQRAVRTSAVSTLGFPFSVSPTFLARNQKQTIADAERTLEGISKLASAGSLGLTVYISMAFGNPYGDPWQPEDVVHACRSLRDKGVLDISLADTVGVASQDQIFSLLSAVIAEVPGIALGAHLHARRDEVEGKLSAAYRAGCRRLDMAMGGLGGCPLAQDQLVGNIPTELALPQLRLMGAQLPPLEPIDSVQRMNGSIAGTFGAEA